MWARLRSDLAVAAGAGDELVANADCLLDGCRAELGADRAIWRGAALKDGVAGLSSVLDHLLDRLGGRAPLPVHHAQAGHRQPCASEPLLVAHALQDPDALPHPVFHPSFEFRRIGVKLLHHELEASGRLQSRVLERSGTGSSCL